MSRRDDARRSRTVAEGYTTVVLDVEDTRATIYEVAGRGTERRYLAVLCKQTPCVTHLEPGHHSLAFVWPDGEDEWQESLVISQEPTVCLVDEGELRAPIPGILALPVATASALLSVTSLFIFMTDGRGGGEEPSLRGTAAVMFGVSSAIATGLFSFVSWALTRPDRALRQWSLAGTDRE